MKQRAPLVLGSVALMLGAGLQAIAASATDYDCGGVGGEIRRTDAMIPSRNGTTLEAAIFAPDASRQTAPCPLVTMLPGGGAAISSVAWAAQRLAANGYVVIITDPEPRSNAADYDSAARSGIDYMESAANPYASDTDLTRVGGTGWSLGARSFAWTQEEDLRLDAIVGWDNIAMSETGDDGSPLCTNSPNPIRSPRVPALGQASETCSGKSADAKKAAYNHWRTNGVPSHQVVFAGCNHFCWSADGSTEEQKDLNHYYTLAWFDRWLKDDAAATDRLLARTVLGRPLEEVLSTTYRSAAYVDGYDCRDLRTACPGEPGPDPTPTPGSEVCVDVRGRRICLPPLP